MISPGYKLLCFFAALAMTHGPVFCETLSLASALERAKAFNGRITAANKELLSARQAVFQSQASFFPSIAPTYRHFDQDRRFLDSDIPTGKTNFNEVALSASWTVWDAGNHIYNYQRSRKLAEATSYSTQNTLRNVLFEVTSRYYDTLRSNELLKVAQAQVQRAQETLDVTKRQAEIGQIARKEVLQAEADLANAQVNQLIAENQVTVSENLLKTIIRWPEQTDLPDLETPKEPLTIELEPLNSVIEEALTNRPDLQSARKRLEAERYQVLSTEREAGLDWRLTIDYTRVFEPENTANRTLQFIASYPLFDGGFSKARAGQAKSLYEANQLLLEQTVRDATGEIEAVYRSFAQIQKRLIASEKALAAARENFKAASESYREGASNIQSVSLAQVALITAETNYVQVVYDYYILDFQLKLVTGKPVPGENNG
jgi:outer membrane protein